jgi:hypothetical protein
MVCFIFAIGINISTSGNSLRSETIAVFWYMNHRTKWAMAFIANGYSPQNQRCARKNWVLCTFKLHKWDMTGHVT